MRYKLVRVADNTVIETRDAGIDPTVQTKPGFKWLPSPFVTKPDFDAKTETVEGPFYQVNAKDVTESWNKRLLTPAELDTHKEIKLDAIDALQFKIMFDMENRVRALESKAPITAAQYRAALKARL